MACGMRTYLIRMGRQSLAVIEASNPQQALFDYARSMGCRDDELMKLGPDAISWRGAVYKAIPAPAPSSRSSSGAR